MLQRQETKTSATQMAGLLSEARARAVSEGTPHLVYFNPPSVDSNGDCGVAAVEVRDADHSYSITDGDEKRDFRLPASACNKVTPYGQGSTPEATATMPMPREDLAVRAADASLVGAVTTKATVALADTVGAAASTVTGILGAVVADPNSASSSGEDSSGEDSSGSGSSNSGPGNSNGNGKALGLANGTTVADATLPPRTATVAETVTDGATFPIDADSGRPVVAFSEHGIPVDPADPSTWGGGAGGIYLTDGSDTVYAALVAPLGDITVKVFDPGSQTWK